MVEVTASWHPRHIPHSLQITEEEGWSTEQSSSVVKAVSASISSGVSYGAVSLGSEIGASLERTTHNSIIRTRTKKRTWTYMNKDGDYLWTWRWHVKVGDEPPSYIATSQKVQAHMKPKCAPGG